MVLIYISGTIRMDRCEARTRRGLPSFVGLCISFDSSKSWKKLKKIAELSLALRRWNRHDKMRVYVSQCVRECTYLYISTGPIHIAPSFIHIAPSFIHICRANWSIYIVGTYNKMVAVRTPWQLHYFQKNNLCWQSSLQQKVGGIMSPLHFLFSKLFI